MNVLLWIIQVVLALLFLLAGGSKLVLPYAEMTKQVVLPEFFLRFLGGCEVLGAFGLILPGLFRILPGLTPLAALGLMTITIGATTIVLQSGGGFVQATLPLSASILAAIVVYGRWRLVPLRRR